MPPERRPVLMTLLIVLGLFLLPVGCAAWMQREGATRDWRSPDRWGASNLAPTPATTPEAIVQIYAARTVGWKGALAVHSWIAFKEQDAPAYERWEVVAWGTRTGGAAVRRDMRPVDGFWAGNAPTVIAELRGQEAAAVIPQIKAAIADYPYQDTYVTWPGPNSNTFVAYVLRQVPAIRAELPPTAIGKDFIPDSIVGPAPSGSGYQLSLFGLAGIMVAVDEGLEVNLLGLVFGIDPKDLAIKLPASASSA